MKIRVVKGFNGYTPGQEFDWSDGFARILVARGLVEPVREATVERAVTEERSERATIAASGKKRAK